MLSEARETNKDLIQEILNNNQRDEGCLKDILNMLLKKPSRTWEDVADALREIGKDKLAESLYVKCKTSPISSLYLLVYHVVALDMRNGLLAV